MLKVGRKILQYHQSKLPVLLEMLQFFTTVVGVQDVRSDILNSWLSTKLQIVLKKLDVTTKPVNKELLNKLFHCEECFLQNLTEQEVTEIKRNIAALKNMLMYQSNKIVEISTEKRAKMACIEEFNRMMEKIQQTLGNNILIRLGDLFEEHLCARGDKCLEAYREILRQTQFFGNNNQIDWKADTEKVEDEFNLFIPFSPKNVDDCDAEKSFEKFSCNSEEGFPQTVPKDVLQQTPVKDPLLSRVQSATLIRNDEFELVLDRTSGSIRENDILTYLSEDSSELSDCERETCEYRELESLSKTTVTNREQSGSRLFSNGYSSCNLHNNDSQSKCFEVILDKNNNVDLNLTAKAHISEMRNESHHQFSPTASKGGRSEPCGEQRSICVTDGCSASCVDKYGKVALSMFSAIDKVKQERDKEKKIVITIPSDESTISADEICLDSSCSEDFYEPFGWGNGRETARQRNYKCSKDTMLLSEMSAKLEALDSILNDVIDKETVTKHSDNIANGNGICRDVEAYLISKFNCINERASPKTSNDDVLLPRKKRRLGLDYVTDRNVDSRMYR
ncbi:uncharacterized protein LOC135690593 [Rhopilema esculentum]|uniref:uncharacterized protein LOC135690593 n=1 Tax=Rhopilema esculentum TaxID=499914 RepID=UPI0031D67AD7